MKKYAIGFICDGYLGGLHVKRYVDGWSSDSVGTMVDMVNESGAMR